MEQGSHQELTAAGGLYARMWADYNQAVQWKITSEGRQNKCSKKVSAEIRLTDQGVETPKRAISGRSVCPNLVVMGGMGMPGASQVPQSSWEFEDVSFTYEWCGDACPPMSPSQRSRDRLWPWWLLRRRQKLPPPA